MKYLILSVLILSSGLCSAQMKWSVISTFSGGSYSYLYPIPYFYNEQYGFVLLQNSDSTTLYRTINGGKSWKRINVVLILDKSPTSIHFNNLYFDNPTHLFGKDANNVYESLDSGVTWKYLFNRYGGNGFYYFNGGFYSDDGYFSNDNGKTWVLDYGPFWQRSQAVIGNKENGIACLGGSQGTLVTTDAGYSWNINPNKNSLNAGYAIPFTFTYFGYHQTWSSTDSVMRTSNGGMTWSKVYPNKLSSPKLEGEITGSSNVLFSEGSTGVVRSTDLGITWDSISNLKKRLHPHLSAVARGAICFVADDTGRLWKFVDSSLLRNATWDLTVLHSSNSISHDTIFARTCDSARLIINYGFKGSDYVKLDYINVEGISASEYRADFVKNKVIMSGRADTSGITFLPSLPGIYPIKVHSFIMRDDWVREDTVFSLTLVVKPNGPVLSVISKKGIDFGAQILCSAKTVTDTFSISNIGCDSLKIQNIQLEVDQGPKSDFSFAQFHSFELFRNEPARKFLISYKPSVVGTMTGRIIISTTAGTDTIPLQGEGLRDRHAISFPSDTLRARVGDTAIGYLPISNLGCRLMDLDSVQTQTPLIFPASQFYLPLGTGKVETIKVYFSPQKPGLSVIPFHAYLRVLTESDTVSFDTPLSVIVEGLTGNQSGVLSRGQRSAAKEITITSLRPNPAIDEIEMGLLSSIEETVKVEILNPLGLEVLSETMHLGLGSNVTHLRTHALSDGTYYIRITGSNGVTSTKFVKIN